MTKVAILWHMHQPYYEDLLTGEHILPWVRFHALKDYFGMVALLREFPSVRVTFNLVPSLLVQLQAFAEGHARDRYLELGLAPAAALTNEQRAFIVGNFFHAKPARMIEPHPRYRELLVKRRQSTNGASGRGDRAVWRHAARSFTEADLRDLQVWQKLAWIDPLYLDRDERVRALIGKGRSFSEDDKITLREVELELLNRVIPEYREAAERGQIELSTSPFYHPILPLLCDTDVHLRTHPHSRLPRRRFRHPEDAAEQIGRAVQFHERLFGMKPAGLWPSEGSVSNAIVPLAAAAGIRWVATDEVILGRTLGVPFTRDRQERLEQPETLYRPYVIRAGDARVACTFRDHHLSDLISFTYAGWDAEAAAADLIARLRDAGRLSASRTNGAEAIVPIILDGENAWEHFEGGGRPFLRALYRRLSSEPDLGTVTMAEACAEARTELDGIFPGSWIDGDFYIWIGHEDDQKACGQLADAREALETPGPGVAGEARERARQEVLIAEGSDWFWWYGDDRSSEHDPEFDDLFRRHLRNVYQALGKPIPEELLVTNITTAAPATEAAAPPGLIEPIIDGEVSS